MRDWGKILWQIIFPALLVLNGAGYLWLGKILIAVVYIGSAVFFATHYVGPFLGARWIFGLAVPTIIMVGFLLYSLYDLVRIYF